MTEEYRCRGSLLINPTEMTTLSGIGVCDSRFQVGNIVGDAPQLPDTWETPWPYTAANRFSSDTIPELAMIDAVNSGSSEIVHTFGIPSTVRADLGMVGFDMQSFDVDGALEYMFVLRILSHDPSALPSKTYKAIEFRYGHNVSWDIYAIEYNNDVLVSEEKLTVSFQIASEDARFSPFIDIATGDALINVYNDQNGVDAGVFRLVDGFFNPEWPITICGDITLMPSAGNLAFSAIIDPSTVPAIDSYDVKTWCYYVPTYMILEPPAPVTNYSEFTLTDEPPPTGILTGSYTGTLDDVVSYFTNTLEPQLQSWFAANLENQPMTIMDGADLAGTVTYVSDVVYTPMEVPGDIPGPPVYGTPQTDITAAKAIIEDSSNQFSVISVTVFRATYTEGTRSSVAGPPGAGLISVDDDNGGFVSIGDYVFIIVDQSDAAGP